MKTVQQSYPALAQALGIPSVYLKREDEHKFGSHKGRSIPLMIERYHKEGWNKFVISSSGNAALAAILFVTNHNKNNPDDLITLKVFVGHNIDAEKLSNLKSTINHQQSTISIEQTDKPKQSAFQLDRAGAHKLLRQSTDDLALVGYHELAQELDKIENLQAVFIPTSSGTTAEGLAQAFTMLKNKPEIHIVQTIACHPIVSSVIARSPEDAGRRGNPGGSKLSIADAIVDNVAHRKLAVVKAVKDTGGSGWVPSDKEIKEAIDLVRKTIGISISPNSALSVAGLVQATKTGHKFIGSVVCLITGK